MFKLLDDVEMEMQKIYPDVNVGLFIHQLFTKIVDKTLQSGGCSVRELGKFVAFQAFSSKLNRNIIRFKFITSISFLKRIRFDELLMENLPVKDKFEFGEKHESVCCKTRHNSVDMTIVKRNVTASEQKVTKENLGKLEIMKILNDEI